MRKGGLLLGLALFLIGGAEALGAEEKRQLAVVETVIEAADSEGHMESESELGDLIADGLRWYGQGDAALFPCGDLSGANLLAGEAGREELEACFDADDMAVRLTVSGSELHRLLWHSVSNFKLNEQERIDWESSRFDGYLHTSGLMITFDYSALPDTPVYWLRRSDKTEIPADDSAEYILVTTKSVAEGEYGYELPADVRYEELGRVTEVMEAYIRELGTVSEPKGERIKVIGTKEYTVVRKWPWQFFLLAVVLFGGGGYLKERVKRSWTR